MSDTSPTVLPSRRQLREQAGASTGAIPVAEVSRRERRLREQAVAESTDVLPTSPEAAPAVATAPTSYAATPVLVPPPALDSLPAPAPTASPLVPPSPPLPTVSAPVLSRRQLREQQAALSTAPVVPPTPVEAPPSYSTPSLAPAAVGPLPPVFSDPAQSMAVEAPTAPSRSVGVSAPATNALILPTAPSLDLAGPIGDTGEILVTGNIPLPRLVSEKAMTGLVDADTEDDFVSVDTGAFTAPVRATQAVSTRSLEIEQPMIKRPSWGMASMVLAFSAAILGVTALALLALALLTDIITLPF